jgi:RNA polymerase sigma-70 factor (ECF subfamily)
MDPERRRTLQVLQAQAGDRAALGALLAEVQAPLHRYLRGLIGAHALADDVLQDVFVLVHRKLGGLRDPAQFRAWLYRVATREAFRQLRRARRWGDAGEPGPELADPRPPEPLARILQEELLARVAALPPASRAVVLLHYGEDLALDEVAAALGVPPGTVKSRLAYGLAALRRRLAAEAP